MSETVETILTAACEFADHSRKVILEYWANKTFHCQSKSDASPVTTADLEGEKVLRKLIRARFPTHGIVGEEFGSETPEAEYQWVLDPIDGTENFAAGIPTFGTIVGIRKNNKPFAGLLDFPALGERYWGAPGYGAFRNGVRLPQLPHESERGQSSRPIVGMTSRYYFERSARGKVFDQISQHFQSVRIYYDCFAHALAAQGSLDAHVEYGLKLWDFAGSEAIILGAGGDVRVLGQHEGPYPTYDIAFGHRNTVAEIRKIATEVQ